MALAPCLACRRHVDLTRPGACPFCGASGTLRPRVPTPGRRTRRATAALASLALAGCGGSDATTAGTDAGTDAVVETASADSGVGVDSGAADSAKPTDAMADATDAGGDVAGDASDTGIIDSGFFPPYGHPPWDERVV